MTGVRCVLRLALVCALLAGCAGGQAPTQAPTPAVRAISLIVGAEDDPYTRALLAGATAEAAARGVPLRVFRTGDRVQQRVRIFEGIERPDRAIVVAPVDYLDAYLLLRTAHDRQVPTFVLDLDPPPATNQAYVWTFLTTGRVRAAQEGARVLRLRLPKAARSVVVVASEEADPGPSLAAQAQLGTLLPGVTVRREVLATGDVRSAARLGPVLDGAGGILATDERAAEALLRAGTAGSWAGRVPLVALGATALERAGLRSGVVAALVAPQPGELGRRAVRYAVAAAANQPDRLPRTVRLDVVVLTRSDLGTAKERSAAYPGEPDQDRS